MSGPVVTDRQAMARAAVFLAFEPSPAFMQRVIRWLTDFCQLTLADLMVAPQVYYLAATPEGAAILKDTALLSWLGRMNARPSMMATVPPEALRKAA